MKSQDSGKIPHNKEPHCMSSNRKIESHKLGGNKVKSALYIDVKGECIWLTYYCVVIISGFIWESCDLSGVVEMFPWIIKRYLCCSVSICLSLPFICCDVIGCSLGSMGLAHYHHIIKQTSTLNLACSLLSADKPAVVYHIILYTLSQCTSSLFARQHLFPMNWKLNGTNTMDF